MVCRSMPAPASNEAVECRKSWKLTEFVTHSINEQSYGDDQAEWAAEHTKQTALAFGRMVEILASKGMLTEYEVLKIVDK